MLHIIGHNVNKSDLYQSLCMHAPIPIGIKMPHSKQWYICFDFLKSHQGHFKNTYFKRGPTQTKNSQLSHFKQVV